MGFDDFFEQKHKNYGHYNKQSHDHDHRQRDDDRDGFFPTWQDKNRYHDDDHHRQGFHPSGYQGYDHQKWLDMLNRLKSGRHFRLIAGAGAVLLLIVIAVLLLVFLPLIIKLINYIGQVGIQGVLNDITGFIDKIWKGSK